jgi:hypothetical protein
VYLTTISFTYGVVSDLGLFGFFSHLTKL